MELESRATGPNVCDAGAEPVPAARDEPAADEQPPLKGLAERSVNKPEPLTTTRKPRERKPSRKIEEAAAAAEKAAPPKTKKRKKEADPNKKTAADHMRDMHARARAHFLRGGSLEEAKVDGLTTVELVASCVVIDVVPKSQNNDARRAALKSWFKSNGGRPIALSEQRAAFLRLKKWRDAEAIAAQLPEKRKADAPPPLDAELLERFKAHKLLNHETDAQKTAAESPEKSRQRDPASLSFESIDRRSF